ncbi:sigma-70 family RNA polymerase sigma factor [Verrucomicrobiaceae bacterium N1E253]|uniref:Sigma-70 family RNA polymerase sigma factor n=1 Tax=Oceaniferula marina TaxID=2748318 RepID=A0A851GK24_9BACT|nr:sigma-70 family RNA polymerase sigma factor [Oceaniferula marina]NWK55060.1 sigma-70 family RNA polymerase sigma factor [Oceaniferula marina]
MPNPPIAADAEERMIGLISKHQVVLHDYIFALIQDATLADDILQETNLVLWRKASEYDLSRPFLPWARGIAWNQVRAASRDASRDRLVFSRKTMELLAQESEQSQVYLPNQREQSLAECIALLTPKQQALVKARYFDDISVHSMAEQLDRPASSISQALYLIRNKLKQCVQIKTSAPTTLK